MTDLLFFREMYTPRIMIVLYWLSLVGVICSGLFSLFFVSVWVGLATLIFGTIGVRLWYELILIAFKIHENLQRIADREA